MTTAIAPPKRGRPPDPRLEALDLALIAIVKRLGRMTCRGCYYQCVIQKLVPKTDNACKLVERRLLKLRRSGRMGFDKIVDESRIVYGNQRYAGLSDLADAAAELYRRDYWNHLDISVQVWIEKRGLASLLMPTVVHKWGLDLYVAGGNASDSYIYTSGREIARQGKPTHVYVLTDFDPGGGDIFKCLNEGTADAPGGISRFTEGVPVFVHRLALTHDQVTAWNLPTRPLKMSDKRAPKFREKHGDISCELDSIEPAKLIGLVDDAIASHMPQEMLERLQNVEEAERETLREMLESLAGDDPDDDIEDEEVDDEEN